MLTPKTLKSVEQARWYFSRDSYYLDGDNIVQPKWWGTGAKRMGLKGKVTAAKFDKMLKGELPNGQIIPAGSQARSPGTDLLFAAPKSVSIQALVFNDERVLRAHAHAVTEALAYVEQEMVRYRKRIPKTRELRHMKADNLAAVLFTHQASRKLDPHLHTHALVFNATQRQDGQWRALYNKPFYVQQKVVGAIYRSTLAKSLTDLGYQIERHSADGDFRLTGHRDEHLLEFSKARVAMEAELAKSGADNTLKAGDIAHKKTREPKDVPPSEALRADWRGRAARIGLTCLMPEALTNPLAPVDPTPYIEHALEHCLQRSVLAPFRALLQHALARGLGKITKDDVLPRLKARLNGGALLPVETRLSTDPFDVFVTSDVELLREKQLVAEMVARKNSVEPMYSRAAASAFLAGVNAQSDHTLTPGQAGALVEALSSRDGLLAVQGYAGTGKTTILRHLREALEARGFRVRGFAPSAQAASVLASEAGIESTTLARLLLQSKFWASTSKAAEYWIVDESSMMSNRDAERLLHLARRRGVRLLWVGDRDQLPSVDAGKAFGLMQDEGVPRKELRDILRQRNPRLKQAVKNTIAREHARVLSALASDIRAIKKRSARLENVASAYVQSHLAGESSLVITGAHQDRRTLNAMIRKQLQARGVLPEDALTTSILFQERFTRAQLKDFVNYEPGFVLRFGRHYKRLGVEEGEYVRVLRVDRSRERVILLRETGEQLAWSPRRGAKVEVYREEERSVAVGDTIRWLRNDNKKHRHNAKLATVLSIDRETKCATICSEGAIQTLRLEHERHWDYAYVSTVHAAQGRTGDQLIFNLKTEDPLFGHENWYVALSRARDRVTIFTDDQAKLRALIARPLEQESALQARRQHQPVLASSH